MNSKCDSPAKHPWAKGGFKHATTEAALIEKYWKRWPNANIGVATGSQSGIIVFDIDPRNGGDESFAMLEAEHGPFPDTVEVLTGGGGRHLYLQQPAGRELRSRSGIYPGIDIKCEGGYVIAPRSNHASGAFYEWEASSDPFDDDNQVAVAAVPEWLLQQLQEKVAVAEPIAGKIGEGKRNDELASLAGTLRRRGCSPDEIFAAISAVNENRCNPPLPDDEVLAIAKSIARYAPDQAAKDIQITISPPVINNGTVAPTVPDNPLAYPWTDLGNAELFADTFGSEWRYDHRRGRWMQWAGSWWRPDATKIVWERAGAVARMRYEAAEAVEDPDLREAGVKFARSCENSGKTKSLLEMAVTLPALKVAGNNWDEDPWLLGVKNGVVELRSGILRPGVREDYITQHVPVEYDMNAECPRFKRFLSEVTGGDKTLCDYLWRVMGYILTADVREQCTFMFYGRGSNGKSTLIKVLQWILGDDPENGYAHTLDPEALQYNSGPASQSQSLAGIVGKRLLTASEISVRRFNENRIKALAGGDRISARFLYQEPFHFQPVAKLVLSFNARPAARDDSDGFWRKVRMVPFREKFDPAAEPDLEDTLRDELPGILAYAVQGVEAWLERGLEPPAAVSAETDRYREEADHLTQFIADAIIPASGERVKAGELYRTYNIWSDEQGLNSREKLSSTAFGRRMGELYERNRTRDGIYYYDIELRSIHTTPGVGSVGMF
jgi:putative DNA primase/helicase